MNFDFVWYHMLALAAAVPYFVSAVCTTHIVPTRDKQTIILLFFAEFTHILVYHFLSYWFHFLTTIFNPTNICNRGSKLYKHLVLNCDFVTGNQLGRNPLPSSISRPIIFNIKTMIVEGYFAVHATHMLILPLKIILLSTSERKLIVWF